MRSRPAWLPSRRSHAAKGNDESGKITQADPYVARHHLDNACVGTGRKGVATDSHSVYQFDRLTYLEFHRHSI
jgi:hypothetical protein